MNDRQVLETKAAETLKRSRLLYLAMAGAVPAMGAVVFLMEKPPEPADPMLPVMLACIAGGMLVALAVVPKMLAKAQSKEGQNAVERAFGAFFTTRILYAAMAESIAVFGLLSSILTGSPLWFFGHAAVFFVAFLLGFPRRSSLMAQLPDAIRSQLERGAYV